MPEVTEYRLRIKNKADTCGNWSQHPDFVPLAGEVCIYSDAITKTIEDGNGNQVVLHEPRIKVGDGITPISDLRFVGKDIEDQVIEHINNNEIHITQLERLKWNAKTDAAFNGNALKLYNEYS